MAQNAPVENTSIRTDLAMVLLAGTLVTLFINSSIYQVATNMGVTDPTPEMHQGSRLLFASLGILVVFAIIMDRLKSAPRRRFWVWMFLMYHMAASLILMAMTFVAAS